MTQSTATSATAELAKRIASLICDSGRAPFGNPFTQDGRIAITNGHIAFLLDCPDECLRLWDENNKPDLDQIIPRQNENPVDVAIPSIEPQECWLDPFAAITADCSECNGTGSVTCEYGHDHECPECDGWGKETGFAIYGYSKKTYVDLEPVGRFDARYLWVIQQITEGKEVTFGTFQTGPIKSLAFYFDGGRGALMGVRKNDAWD